MPTLRTGTYNALVENVGNVHSTLDKLNAKRPNDPLVDLALNQIKAVENQILKINRDAPPL
jgi:hypothetical protein